MTEDLSLRDQLARDPREPLAPRQAVARGIAVALSSAVAAFHIIWLPHKLAEAPYMGGLFISLAFGAAVAALLLAFAGPRLAPAAWAFAAFFAAAPLAGYLSSRFVAWPQQADLVGSWGDPLGIESIVVESLLLVLALAALGGAFRETTPRTAAQRTRDERRAAA